MVYPALTYLEEIEHATVETEGTRKRYHITELGRGYLEEHRSAADSLFAQFGRVGERMESLRKAMRAGEQEFGADDERHGSKPLMRARRALTAVLDGKWDSPAEEQERIAKILQRAAEEIGGGEEPGSEHAAKEGSLAPVPAGPHRSARYANRAVAGGPTALELTQ